MRLWSLEKASIAHEVESNGLISDAPTQVALAWRNLSETGRSLDLLSRYEGRLDSQYNRALRRLEAIQKRKKRTNRGSD